MSSLSVTRDTEEATHKLPEEVTASLYQLYGQRVCDYCYGELRDREEAADALQATFLYAFMLLRRGEKPKRPLPWLYTIAHNVCRTRRRTLKRRRQVESGVDLETLYDSVGRDDPSREDVAELRSSLSTLPPAQREAILLREFQGLSYTEIAARLGLTESAVEAVLFRARRNLAHLRHPLGERVASVVNGVLLLPVIRRVVAWFGGTGKASAAMLIAGTAAATTLLPLTDAPPRPAPAPLTPAHLSPAPSVPLARKPTPAHVAARPLTVESTTTTLRLPAPLAPTHASAASSAATSDPSPTANPSGPTAHGPAASTSAPLALPPLPVPLQTAVSTAQDTADAAADEIKSTVSSVQSAVQSTASSAQSAASSVLPTGSDVPLPGIQTPTAP